MVLACSAEFSGVAQYRFRSSAESGESASGEGRPMGIARRGSRGRKEGKCPLMTPTVTSTAVAGGSPERFGYEWSVYAELRPEYEEQFRRWTAHLTPDDWKGRTFLDVGCGMGRNSYWPMTYGAEGGVAIDIDPRSLQAAKAILRPYPSVAVEERSAYDIGYQAQFDIVFSIGVIHHLQFPEKALAEMVR